MENEPIRVAQVIGKWLGGGVESVVMNYYRHIDRSKIQFDFICDNDSTNIPYDEIEKLGGRVILVPPYQKVFKYQKELKRIFKENKYKIVHSHINTLSVFPLYAAKCAKVPVRIAHSHSTTNKKEWKKNLLKQVLRPFSKVYATNYMCCSELAGRWLFGNKEYDKGNVYLLNNAIDLDKFKYDEKIRKQKRKELNINDSTLVIGHIGRFVAQKNHTFLIDIFNEVHKQNNDSLLMLVGQGPLMNEIQEKVNNLGLKDSVIFLGQRNDVNELYQAMDIFVLPSLYEGLPVVGVEAQASGLLCFLSSDMTKETKVLDSTKFMSLSNSAEEWANEILKSFKSYKKHDTNKEVSKYGFDISEETSKLEKYYVKKAKKKIIHLTNSNVFSGLESVVCQIINNTSDEYEHLYVCKNGPIVEVLNKNHISYYLINKMNVREVRKVLKLFKPDIIHSHDFTPSFIAKFATTKIPRINHIHQNPSWLKKINLKSIAFLISSLKAKKIIIVSKSIKEECIFSKLLNNKFYCIDNPISYDLIVNKVKCNDTKLYDICCIGRVELVKNPYKFINIIIKLKNTIPNIKCVWIGDGSLMEELKEYINSHNLKNNIEFVGFMANPYEKLNQSKMFMLCSEWEGFGLVAYEALCLGIPCVVSNKGGLVNIVNENVGALCTTLEEFVDNSKKILSYSDSKLRELSNKCIEHAKKLDNYESYFHKLKGIYSYIESGE